MGGAILMRMRTRPHLEISRINPEGIYLLISVPEWSDGTAQSTQMFMKLIRQESPVDDPAGNPLFFVASGSSS